jgi:hypothetical protein
VALWESGPSIRTTDLPQHGVRAVIKFNAQNKSTCGPVCVILAAPELKQLASKLEASLGNIRPQF